MKIDTIVESILVIASGFGALIFFIVRYSTSKLQSEITSNKESIKDELNYLTKKVHELDKDVSVLREKINN